MLRVKAKSQARWSYEIFKGRANGGAMKRTKGMANGGGMKKLNIPLKVVKYKKGKPCHI